MAALGTDLKDYEFYDPETAKTYKVTISVRDMILFKLLERIAGALK